MKEQTLKIKFSNSEGATHEFTHISTDGNFVNQYGEKIKINFEDLELEQVFLNDTPVFDNEKPRWWLAIEIIRNISSILFNIAVVVFCIWLFAKLWF